MHILLKKNPVHAPASSFLIYFNIIHPVPSGPFPSDFLTTTTYAFLSSTVNVICATQLKLPEYANNIWRRMHIITFLITHIMKLLTMDVMKLHTMHFLQVPVTSSLLRLNILLSTLFSKILTLCSSLKVRDYFSYLYSSQLLNFVTYYSYELLPKKTEQPNLVSESHFRSQNLPVTAFVWNE